MPALRLVLADQLTPDVAALRDWEEGDVILMAEVAEEATYVHHHKKKIAFLFSAMRHFAAELQADGREVRYRKLDDSGNQGSLRAEVAEALEAGGFDRVVCTKPGEYRLLEDMERWEELFLVPVELRDDDRFICSIAEFNAWADGRKSLRQEHFYRQMRRKTGLLMEGGKPVGGKWNFDHSNRKKLPAKAAAPPRYSEEPDEITRDVIELVETRFGNHFGDIGPVWHYAVTRTGAEAARDAFMRDILPTFGSYQDAMAVGEPWLWHAVLSMYINCGLLDPLDVCERAAAEFAAGRAPVNSVEGFIRQIIGWREYVRGIYWREMPGYRELNYLEAANKLPDMYWTAETDMACMADAIGQTKRHAYAHHIQRLMVTGNFALIAGVNPQEVNDWYLIVYMDAYEWVELPNVHGMAIFADGGIMASKPYAGSGSYINRMSDYCENCRYDVRDRTGPNACPFNYLYWDFIARNRDKLERVPRMGLIYRNLDRQDEGDVRMMRERAAAFLKSQGMTPPVGNVDASKADMSDY